MPVPGPTPLDFGFRRTVSQFANIGRGYIIETLARKVAADPFVKRGSPAAE